MTKLSTRWGFLPLQDSGSGYNKTPLLSWRFLPRSCCLYPAFDKEGWPYLMQLGHAKPIREGNDLRSMRDMIQSITSRFIIYNRNFESIVSREAHKLVKHAGQLNQFCHQLSLSPFLPGRWTSYIEDIAEDFSKINSDLWSAHENETSDSLQL